MTVLSVTSIGSFVSLYVRKVFAPERARQRTSRGSR